VRNLSYCRHRSLHGTGVTCFKYYWSGTISIIITHVCVLTLWTRKTSSWKSGYKNILTSKFEGETQSYMALSLLRVSTLHLLYYIVALKQIVCFWASKLRRTGHFKNWNLLQQQQHMTFKFVFKLWHSIGNYIEIFWWCTSEQDMLETEEYNLLGCDAV
jgi:hypothetical protein